MFTGAAGTTRGARAVLEKGQALHAHSMTVSIILIKMYTEQPAAQYILFVDAPARNFVEDCNAVWPLCINLVGSARSALMRGCYLTLNRPD